MVIKGSGVNVIVFHETQILFMRMKIFSLKPIAVLLSLQSTHLALNCPRMTVLNCIPVVANSTLMVLPHWLVLMIMNK